MRVLSISIALSILACVSNSRDTESAHTLPRFEDFQVPQTSVPPAPKLDTAHNPDAKMFRTVLQSALQSGPNFAGHYTIATWGCGTQCVSYAVIDAVTGRLSADSVLDFSCHVVDFRKTSSLVIERPMKESGAPCGDTSTKAFTWNGTGFQPIK